MSGFELNKIAGAVLLAGLIAMITGKVADILYVPELEPEKKGYIVNIAAQQEVPTAAAGNSSQEVNLSDLLAKANVEKGQKIFRKCIACHTSDKDGANRVGPNLWEIIDREKAIHEGFAYSTALKSLGGKWTYEDLYRFIHNPRKDVPGTKMSFPGIKDPQEIADLIAYIRTFSANPKPLP